MTFSKFPGSESENSDEHKTTEESKVTPSDPLVSAWKYDQTQYRELVQLAMMNGLDLLKKNVAHSPRESLFNLYVFLCKKRSEIAFKLMPKGDELGPASDFGKLRTLPDFFTQRIERRADNPGFTHIPNAGRYQAIYPSLIDKLTNLQKSENNAVRVVTYGPHDDYCMTDAYIIQNNGIVLSSLGYEKNCFFTDLIYPEPIPNGLHHDACLTGNEKTEYLKTHPNLNPRKNKEEKDPMITIIHPSPKEVIKIFDEIEKIYVNLIKEQHTDKKNVIESIAMIAWWLSQAMRCKRGNASVTEMMIEILFKQFNIEYQPYKSTDHVTLDLKAIFEPDPNKFLIDFVNAYSLDYKQARRLTI